MKKPLKVWRAKGDVKQAELTEEVNVSRQTINAVERARDNPSLELAFTLPHYFDCAIEDIFEYDSCWIQHPSAVLTSASAKPVLLRLLPV